MPERRGHGRTPDTDGEISYQLMADDTMAFIDAVEVGPAHLVGFSDGGVIAMLVAIQRPDLVRKLVIWSAPAEKSGQSKYATAFFAALTPDSLPLMMLRGLHESVSPDGPDHWPIICEKMLRVWREGPPLSLEALRAVQAASLVMLGDDDIMTVEHAAAMAGLLPEGQLAVVPGASHGAFGERPELVNRIILEFLEPSQPYKTWSLTQGTTYGRWWE